MIRSFVIIAMLATVFSVNKVFADEAKASSKVNSVTDKQAVTKINEAKSTATKSTQVKSSKAPVIIRSQVKGSQEQPNVIYILPWQGVNKVIEVEGKQRTIKLPEFQPINPRKFKQQVKQFSLQQQLTKAVVNQE